VPRVRVVPRATVFRYKGRAMDPGELGVELNASALVSGRVVVRGATLTVQADLTDVATNAQLWGQRYARPAADLLALQESLAEEIADALRGRLTDRRKRRAPTAASAGAVHPDSAAYEEYLRGRFEANKWTAEGFRKAVQHYETAVARDPGFAPAWAGIAEAVGVAVYFGYLDPSMLTRSHVGAQRAIELAPNLAEAHAVRGLGAFFFDWSFAEARQAFERALTLNPHLATTHVYYSLFLAAQGEFEAAVREAQTAERLDPVAPITMRGVAWAMHFAGHDQRALAQLHRILGLEPGSALAHGILMWLHEMRGEFDAALSHVGPWIAGEGLPMELAERLREAYEESGPQGYWRARLEMIERAGLQGRLVAFAASYLRLQLGEREQALDRLEQSVEQRVPALVFLAVDRSFKALHGDPRFEAVRERVGLPAVQPRSPLD
jgi:tetratricopeptide (TPR) repeat protein